MSLIKKLFGFGSTAPKTRVRVCVECGMPLDQHKDWCAIHQTRQEMEQKRSEAADLRS